MRTILILIQPWRKSAGARVDVRIGDSPSPDGYGVGGFEWEPAVSQRPVLSLECMSPEIDGKVKTGQARFTLQLHSIKAVSDPMTLDWQGAPVTIWTCDDLAWDRRVVEFTGNVSTSRLDLDTGAASIDAATSAVLLDVPLLTKSFSGAGGLDGDAAKRGVLRPAGFGHVENMEPVWFDETYNIGQIDGYQNTLAITRLKEGLNDLGASVNDYATYALLKQAIIDKVIPRGRWGTCIAEGLIGLGAPPVARISADATFGSNRAGAIMQRAIEVHAGVAPALVDEAALAALSAAVDRPMHHWTAAQRQVRDLCEAISASCNATLLISFQGMVTVSRAVTTAAVATLDRSGAIEPRVINWKSADSVPPYYQLKARVARPGSVFSRDEVLFVDNFVPMGVFDNTATYRAGNTVFKADGSEFLYINAAPAAGHAPPAATYPPAAPAADAYWQQLQPATSYADGTPIDSLKPQEVGANKTETRTASSIAGQGQLATLNTTALGSSGQVVRSDGVTKVTDAAAITSLGTAAGIAGQGSLATQNAVAYTTQITSLPTAIQPANLVGGSFIDAGYTKYDAATTVASLKPAQANADVTGSNTAAAIASQGALATLSSVAWGSAGRIYRDDGTTRVTDALAVTSLGTASAIAGQGALATLSAVDLSGSTVLNKVATNIAETTTRKWAAESGADITGSHSASAIAGQGALATLNTVRLGTTGRVLREDGTTSLTDALAVTSLGTAAGIVSQGALATKSAVAYGTADVSGFGALAGRSTARIGTELVRADGTTATSDAILVTSLGTAASIAGQGAFATVSSAAYGSSYLTGFGTLAPRNNVRLANEVYRADGATVLTDAAAVTSLGTAAGITGQGTLATQSQVYFDGGYIKEAVGGVDATLSNFKTGLGTASAIAGQGALATVSSVAWGSSGRVYRDDGVTRVTDALSITSLGTAASIASQGSFATLSQTYFGDGLLRETSGGTTATLANFKTSSGTAAGIASQGALATLSSVALGAAGRVYRDDGVTRLTDSIAVTSLGSAASIAGQGSFATLSQTYFGDGLLKETSGGTTATLVNFKTSSGTAAAIAGQGSLATRNTARIGTEVYRADGTTATTDAMLVTSLGTAASIAGQGTGATANNLAQLNSTEGAKLTGISAGATVGDNLIPNPTFVVDASGWSVLAGTATRTVGGVGDPHNYLRCINGTVIAVASPITIPAGRTMYLSFWKRVVGGNGYQTAVNYYYTNSAGVNAFGTTNDFNGNDGVWTFVQRTIPSGSANTTLTLYNIGLTAGGAGTYQDVTGFRLSSTQESADVTIENPRVASSEIGATKGDNLIPNADLNDGTVGWGSQVVNFTRTASAAGDPTPWHWTNPNGDTFGTGGPTRTVALPAHASKLYLSGWFKNTVAGQGAQITVYFTDAVGAFLSASGMTSTTAGTGWEQRSSVIAVPAGAAYFIVWLNAPANGKIALPRASVSQAGSTLGAAASSNLFQSDGVTVMAQNEVRTAEGTAASIAGQGTFATLSQTYFGDGLLRETSGGTTATLANFKTSSGTAASIASQGALATLSSVAWGASGRVYRDDGSTRVTDSTAITSLGTAASIAGQGALATKSAVDLTTTDVTNKRLSSLNTNAVLGPRNTTTIVPTYTVGGSNVTVNIPAHTRKVAGSAGAVTLSYGSGSGVVAFSAVWYCYIANAPATTGVASPTYVFTTNPDDLLVDGVYHVASGVAPAAGGTGGTTGSGGGSGSGVGGGGGGTSIP